MKTRHRGKSTISRVQQERERHMVVHMDDLYENGGAFPIEEWFAEECDQRLEHLGDGTPAIAGSNIHRVRRQADKYASSYGKELDDWFLRACDEAKWASDVMYHDRPFGVAWSVGNVTFIRAPFSLLLWEDLNNISDGFLKRGLGFDGWVIYNVDKTSPDFHDIVSYYLIECSPILQSEMTGHGKWKEELQKHEAAAREKGFEVPHIFQTSRTYKPHQSMGIVAMSGLGAVLLGDQVGLGKGGSFIGGYLSILQRAIKNDLKRPGPLVLITRASMKQEIAEEVIKWKNDAVVEIVEGKKPAPIDEGVEFIVINSDILASRFEDIIEAEPGGVVVDEAHMMTNPQAQRTQATQRLADYVRSREAAPYVVMATGTPFTNRPVELISILKILGVFDKFVKYAAKYTSDFRRIKTKQGPRNVPASDEFRFQERWCDGHYNKYKVWECYGSSNTAELNRLLLKYCMFRRRKSDVMHPLPDLNENVVMMDLDFTSPEGREYINIEEDFRRWAREQALATAEEEGLSERQALKILKRKLENAEGGMRFAALRQAISRFKFGPVKQWIKDFMVEGEDNQITGGDPTRRKLIVFAYYREMIDQLISDPELDQYGKVFIDAGQPDQDIQDAKTRFQRDPDTRLIICYSGAREGHTLTAAKDVMIAEIPFVPSWIIQMAGRCWARISEEFEAHEAYLHYALARSTVDTVVFQKNRLKKAMFNAVIDGEGLEELKELSVEDNPSNAGDMFLELVEAGKKSVTIAS